MLIRIKVNIKMAKISNQKQKILQKLKFINSILGFLIWAHFHGDTTASGIGTFF